MKLKIQISVIKNIALVTIIEAKDFKQDLYKDIPNSVKYITFNNFVKWRFSITYSDDMLMGGDIGITIPSNCENRMLSIELQDNNKALAWKRMFLETMKLSGMRRT